MNTNQNKILGLFDMGIICNYPEKGLSVSSFWPSELNYKDKEKNKEISTDMLVTLLSELVLTKWLCYAPAIPFLSSTPL